MRKKTKNELKELITEFRSKRDVFSRTLSECSARNLAIISSRLASFVAGNEDTIMNDAERLRVLVRALLPFALAADDQDVHHAEDERYLLLACAVEDDDHRSDIGVGIDIGPRWLTAADLRAAADALRAAGYADALTDSNARAALEDGE